MKEKLLRLRTFVCFYLTLPAFVSAFLFLGISVSGKAEPITKERDTAYNIEKELPSIDSIDNEIGIPDGTYPIIAKDLSKDYAILNSTNESIDEEELLSYSLPHGNSEPLVLVVHTHGTECYSESDESFTIADVDGNYGFYTDKSQTRTTDTSNNVIAVGEAFCTALAEKGIQSIQCRIMHDKDDYNSSYSNSRKTIREYLEKYPSISYVIDLHRDSLGSEGEKIKTLAGGIDGCAQVMLVAGCNGNGVVYPLWKENLALAAKYKKVMDTKYPSLSRPIYLRYSRYNLDLHEGSLLLEVGSCGNTLNEAVKAARLAAECFAELLE